MPLSPTLKKIQDQIVTPKLDSLRNAVMGTIAEVDYTNRTCTVVFIDKDSARRTKTGVAFPKDGDGVFTQALKAGDKVELSFRNQTVANMYISAVYKKNQSAADYTVTFGQTLPLSTELF